MAESTQTPENAQEETGADVLEFDPESPRPDPGAEVIEEKKGRPAPKRPRRRRKKTEDSTDQTHTNGEEEPRRKVVLKGSLASKLPSAESVKIYKKDKLGKASLINTYTAREIMAVGDFETFIQHNLLPSYRGGDYTVDLINPKGHVSHTVTLGFADPPGVANPDSASEQFLRTQLEKMQEKLDKQTAEQKVDPIQFMVQAKELFGKDHEGNSRGMDPGLMMMLMQMFQKEDPTVAQVRAEIEGLKKELDKPKKPAAAPAPMPRLDKEDDNTKSMTEMFKFITQMNVQQQSEMRAQAERQQQQFQEFMKTIVSLQATPKDDGNKEQQFQIQLQQLQHDFERRLAEANKANEMQKLESKFDALLREMQGGGGDDLETLFSKVESLVAISDRISGTKKQQADSLWGFLNNFVNNASSVSDGLERVVASIRESNAAESGAAPQLTEGAPTAEEGYPEDFPEGATDAIAAIESTAFSDEPEGEREAQVVRAVIMSLFELNKDKVWTRPVQRLLVTALKGNKKPALLGLRDYLQHLADHEMLTGKAAQFALESFEKHYEKVVEQLKGTMGVGGK